MQQKLLRMSVCALMSMMVCGATLAGQTPAAAERVLYSFTGGADGSEPDGGLAIDPQGNIYGSTFSGGATGNGVIFKITRGTSGATENVIYNFQGAPDGVAPEGPLTLGPNGAIYGTTASGGNGFGVVFQLTPNGTTWTETILHVFRTTEGVPVQSGVILDKSGNLYGETATGGAFGDGSIYELRRTASGYKYVVLYSFASGNDGDYPSGGLIMDSNGNLYGVTVSGGPNFIGDVFELQRNADGTFTESILYTFQNTADGVNPEGGLIMDASGNLYGTAAYGGDTSCAEGYGCGEVFELSPAGGGIWTKSTLYAFTGAPDGHAPLAALTFDRAGNLWGTTYNGGTANTGALFELSPTSGGWTEQIQFSFTNHKDGGYTGSPLVFDAKGNLYGTASFGGQHGQGNVFVFPGVGAQ